jgi:hypothetical protein
VKTPFNKEGGILSEREVKWAKSDLLHYGVSYVEFLRRSTRLDV